MAQSASMVTQRTVLRGGGQIHSYLSSPDATSSIPDTNSLVPDQKSPVYPKRAIRPLPKRTLRSRLSEEAAESIAFPPILPSISLPSYSQYGDDGGYLNDSKIHVHQNGEVFDDLDHDHHHDHYHDEEDCPHHHCDHDDEDDLDSIDDGSLSAVRGGTYRSSPRSPRPGRQHRYGSHGARSSPSATDGYDAFENTKNKKKRKIPTSGSLSLGHGSLSADLASMGLGRNGADDGTGVGQYYGSGNAAVPAGLGVQGAGRGRSSRRISGRNPLGPSVNGSNARLRYDQPSPTAEPKAEPGIISAAIANATAMLRKPLNKGQENAGVLEQQAKSPTSSSQFTFTCDTDAPNVTFPEQSLYASSYSQRINNMPAPDQATQGTQTSPIAPHGTQQPPANQQGPPPAAQGKKPRRRRGDVYALAARQRRLQQEYSNLNHTPAPEDIWICEFCEYESIFGRPPTALIRQYEIKDRKERRRLAEKRRLLEKAKLKGRKGKKQTKNAAKAAHANNTPRDHANYGNEPLDQMGDECLDDGYDDDPTPMPALVDPREPQRPMPGSFNSTASNTSKQGIPAGGSGVR